MDVVLMWHGESETNFENYWTRWLGVSLTRKGQEQARKAREKIKNVQIEFDAAFTSVLKRAPSTCQIILEEGDQLWIPKFKTRRLNERHYGALVRESKDEMTREFGADQVRCWRRDCYEMPPLVEENHFDRRYVQLADQDIPHGENLQVTIQRAAPLWQDEIALLLGSGKNVLITGHGNSLRALVRYSEDVPEDQVDTIDIPNV